PLAVNGSVVALVGNSTSLALITNPSATINLSGSSIALFGTTFLGNNIYGGRAIKISPPRAHTTTDAYSADGDLTSTSTSPISISTAAFVVGSGGITSFGQNGSSASLATATGGAGISINGTTTSNPVSSGSFAGGTGTITIVDNAGT